MKKTIVMMLLALATISTGLTTNIAQAAKKSSKKRKKDIDKEITNARLRQATGSKSKYSISGSLSYTGGSVTEPFGDTRPNLYGDPGVETRTSAGIGLSVRYRVNAANSITLGTSGSVLTPLNSEMRILTLNNPSASWSSARKWGRWQMNSSVGVNYGTSDNAKLQDYQYGVAVSHNMLTTYKKLTLGISGGISKSFYGDSPTARKFCPKPQKCDSAKDKDSASKPVVSERGDLTNWAASIYPYLEYAISDKYSLRTVFGWFSWENVLGDKKWTKLSYTGIKYQSVGLGIALTRDIYIYPNIQFLIDDIKSERTNVGISLSYNLF